MIPLDLDVLRAIMPRYSNATIAAKQAFIVESIAGSMTNILSDYQISTRLRIAHFLAQIAHESAGFRTTEEFASGAAYEGRRDLGNSESGDGKRYKGRGLLQLTGRANYRELGGKIGMDLENNPELAAEPKTSLIIACEYWQSRKMNRLCDEDNLVAVTKKVNGGRNGLEDRANYLAKAKIALARIEALPMPLGEKPTLRRGSMGPEVDDLQKLLRDKGYMIAIDGDFGPATEAMVMRFQEDEELGADGIVGKKTWAALEK